MTISSNAQAYRQRRQQHWNALTSGAESGRYYRAWLQRIYQFMVPRGSSVLELGCGEGDLLAALAPSRGVGVDFASTKVERARHKHRGLEFIEADAHALDLGQETFDYIVLSDLINDVWDVQKVFEQLRPYAHPATRIVLNSIAHSWELPIRVLRRLGLATRSLPQNWLTVADVERLLDLAGFEVVHTQDEIIWPLRTPLIGELLNRYLARIFPFSLLCMSHFAVARPRTTAAMTQPTVSIVIAARNEAGNVNAILRRVPELGAATEIVFVEGGSTDGTYEALESAIKSHSRHCQLHRQTGTGKGDAVRLGFNHAHGDILMILDADLTVEPEDLQRFYDALVMGRGEFINGVRMVYPMEDEAMRFFNVIGNKFFSHAFSWLLGQSVKDTLCGTKALWRKDYEILARNRAYFAEFDPFGDFDLLFGAARQLRRIIDLPVRYQVREYGSTNIQRWRHGWLLLKMVVVAARKIKFV